MDRVYIFHLFRGKYQVEVLFTKLVYSMPYESFPMLIMDRIPFFKMSACGNDFCLIDNRKGIFPEPAGSVIRSICTRRISLGADGIILVENSNEASFRMRFYNADGTEVEMCGNGARCIARFAYLNGITSQKMCFDTQAGLVDAEVSDSGARIKISDIRFSPEEGRICLPEVVPDKDAYYLVAGVPVPCQNFI